MELEEALAAYDIMGWARHRLAIAEHEAGSAYNYGSGQEDLVAAWTEVIARIEANDTIGIRGCMATFGLPDDVRGILSFITGEVDSAYGAAAHIYTGSTSISARNIP